MATKTRAVPIPLEILCQSLRHDLRFRKVAGPAFDRLEDMVACLELILGDETLRRPFTAALFYQTVPDFLEGLLVLEMSEQVTDLGPNRGLFRSLIEEYRSGLFVPSADLRSLVQFYSLLDLSVADVLLSQAGLWIPEDTILLY